MPFCEISLIQRRYVIAVETTHAFWRRSQFNE